MQRRSFMKLMATSAVGVGAATALSGCNIKGGSSNIQPKLRFINLANNTPFTVNILTANTTNVVSSNFGTIQFGTATTHQSIDWEGQYQIQLLNSSASILTTLTVSLNQNTSYTLIVYSAAGALRSQLLNDTQLTGINSGQFVMQTLSTITGAGGTAPAYDLYLTSTSAAGAPGTGGSSDLTPLSANVAGAAAGSVSQYSAQTNTGTYRVRLVQAGPQAGTAKTVEFDFPNVNLGTAGDLYTFLIYTTGSASLPTVMLIEQTTDTVQILNNPLARVRVIQGSPDISSSQVTIGSNTVGGLYFGATSNYFTVVASSIAVAFTNTQNSNTAATPYLSYSSTTLAGGQDYSVYSVGKSSSATSLVVPDQNLPVNTSGDSGLFFVNATPTGDIDTTSGLSTASVDCYVAFNKLASGIQSQAAPASNSQVDVLPNQGQVFFTIGGNGGAHLGPAVTTNTTSTVTINNQPVTISEPALVSGGIYTVALVGAAGTYAPVIYQTNQF